MSLTDLGLNEHHEAIVMNYVRFSRYQRIQHLKSVEYSFRDLIDSRFLESTYTSEEIQEILGQLSKLLLGDIETELITSCHTNVLLLKQLFSQAEKWHLRLQADLSELENREQLEQIKTLERKVFPHLVGERAPLSPTKMRLQPINEGHGTISLLRMEVDRLKQENKHLTDELNASNSQVTSNFAVPKELQDAASQTVREIESDDIVQRSPVNNDAVSIEHVCKSKEMDALTAELKCAQEKLTVVQSQLLLAEKELERKFSETAAYINMKKMLAKKNDQIKELRRQIQNTETDEIEI